MWFHPTLTLDQRVTFFVRGENYNHRKSMMFRQVASEAGGAKIFMLAHYTLPDLAEPPRATDKIRHNNPIV